MEAIQRGGIDRQIANARQKGPLVERSALEILISQGLGWAHDKRLEEVSRLQELWRKKLPRTRDVWRVVGLVGGRGVGDDMDKSEVFTTSPSFDFASQYRIIPLKTRLRAL